ncbi:hypothetical protein ACW2QC_07170 [Virgibacillus sp. FSP13]
MEGCRFDGGKLIDISWRALAEGQRVSAGEQKHRRESRNIGGK